MLHIGVEEIGRDFPNFVSWMLVSYLPKMKEVIGNGKPVRRSTMSVVVLRCVNKDLAH